MHRPNIEGNVYAYDRIWFFDHWEILDEQICLIILEFRFGQGDIDNRQISMLFKSRCVIVCRWVMLFSGIDNEMQQ